MNKEQLATRLQKLVKLAEKNGIDVQSKKLIQKIKEDLENTDPNTNQLEFRLNLLEENIKKQMDPEFILEQLKKQLEGRIIEMTRHDLLQFDSSRALSFHPFELLRYENIQEQIRLYLESLRQLLDTFEALVKKLPTHADQKEMLSEFLAEQEALEKQYREIKKTKPKVNRINTIDTLKKLLSEHPEKIDMPGFEGRTLLITYALRGKQDMMAALLENGANINAQTNLDSSKEGNTALLWLIANAYVNEALWLISVGKQYKIDWNLYGHGNTALHLAIAKGPTHITDTGKKVPGGFRKIIHNLIEQGADINLKDKRNGFSPLHLAVLHRDIEIIKKLIEAGADINCFDNQNRKPSDMLNIPRQDIKEILKNQCAAFTLNEDDWKLRGNEVKKLLQVDLSASNEVIDVDKSESSLTENISIENFPSELVSKLSQHATDIKVDNPKTTKQREGNIKSQKIDEFIKLLNAAKSLEEIQQLVNTALKSDYKKGRQQNPLLVNRGPYHAHWIHSIFSKKRNIESHRLSRSTTEDLLIDLKKAVDEAVVKEAESSISHNS